jgi:hypothetical protein
MGRTVEKYSKTKQRKESQRAAHHSIPAFIGRNCRTVEKYFKTKRKESQKRAAHHSIPAS